jgi:hypothetical protein
MMKTRTSNPMLTPHFALREFTESPTAKKHGLDNTPPQEAVDNLKRLCEGTLEPLREELQMPVIVTSGYRCKALNDILIHAARQSQHRFGYAADFHVVQGLKFKDQGSTHRELLIRAFRLIITSPKIDFDKLILYPNFIHVSYVSPQANRHSVMLAEANGKYRAVTRADALVRCLEA